MYVTNPQVIPKEDKFYCNGVLANWLIYEKHFPIFAKENRRFVFIKTKELEEVLRTAPYWIKVACIF